MGRATSPAPRALDIEAMWPDIFEGMNPQQRHTVRHIVAISWHEGREPDREHTARLAALVRGDITEDEFLGLSKPDGAK